MRTRKVASIVVAIAAVAAMMASAQDARAGDDPREPAFRYTTQAQRHYLRTGLEEVLVLGVGYAQYVDNKAANQPDFDNSPDWATLKSKLTLGSAVTFDNNLYDTNWLTHPLAGYFYYGVARSNRLSIPLSAGIAFAGSAIWEVLGEIREDAAINDLIATPLSGMSLYEPMMQTGVFFQRARRTPASVALAWLFAPFKSLHDTIDGLEPERATELDDLGLPADDWHRIRLGGSVGVTHQRGGLTQGDARFYGSSRIITLPRYGREGTTSGFFDAAGVSELELQIGLSEGRMVDANIAAHMLPFGYRAQDVRLTPSGELYGHSFVAGLHIGTEYGRHDYDRDRRRDPDRLAFVSAGTSIEETLHLGALLLRARVDGLATFGGVDAYALPEYERRYGLANVTSVVRNQRYAHTYGATVRPRFELELGRFDSGVDLRGDWFGQVTGRDRGAEPGQLGVAASDRRFIGRTFIGYSPSHHIRLSLTAEMRERMGRIEDIRASRSELGLHGGIEAVF